MEKILSRGVTAFLGTVEAVGRTLFVHSVDRRLSLRCLVPQEKLAGARAGDWVIARITRYPDEHRSAMAEVVRRLDPERPLEMATETAIARHTLPVEFRAAALQEAEAYGERIDPREARGRVPRLSGAVSLICVFSDVRTMVSKFVRRSRVIVILATDRRPR